MAVYTTGPFQGENHSQHGRYLEGNQAQCAINTCMEDGVLRPHKCPELVCSHPFDVKQILSLARCKCIGFDEKTKIAQCFDRIFWVDSATGYLMEATEQDFCTGAPGCRNGVPCPVSAPAAGGGGGDQCSVQYVQLMYTYVKEYAGRCEESAPSPVSGTICIEAGGVVTVGGIAPPPSGYCITKIRAYAIASGDHSGAEPNVQNQSGVVYLGEAGLGGGGFSLSSGGMELLTQRHFPPPRNLDCILATKDGLLGIKGDTIYMTEPGLAHAWNDEYIMCLDDPICYATYKDDSLYIFGVNNNYIAPRTGVNSYDPLIIGEGHKLKSKCSVAHTPDGLVFQSHTGIWLWSGKTIRNLSSAIVNDDYWCKICDENSIGVVYNDMYIFTSKGRTWVMEYGGVGIGGGPKNWYRLPINPDAMYVSNDNEFLYSEGGDIKRFDFCCTDGCDPCDDDPPVLLCDECCPYFWQSLIIDLQQYTMWAAGRVKVDPRTGSTTFRLYSMDCHDRKLIKEVVINGDDNKVKCSLFEFRIPGCIGMRESFQIELEGCAHVYYVALAHNMSELGRSIN